MTAIVYIRNKIQNVRTQLIINGDRFHLNKFFALKMAAYKAVLIERSFLLI